MAALGYEYGCVGLRIWLRWVTNMAALGYEYDCIGAVSVGLPRRLHQLTETSELAD